MKTIHKILILSLILCTGFTAQAQDDSDKHDFFEIGYGATTFEDVTESGYYGFGASVIRWNIKEDLYAGYHFSASMNYGLSDSDSMLIQVGPTFGYNIKSSLTAAMPLTIMCGIPIEEGSSSLSWGMGLTPTFYIGQKKGLYVGPSLTVPFTKGTKVTFGFKAGFFIDYKQR